MGIWVKQDFSGDWVKYEDYEKLKKENERLKELLEIAPTHIRRKLNELEEKNYE
jgi:hypothetical protein